MLYTTNNGQPGLSASTALIDREGSLWLGFDKKGLVRVTEKNLFKLPLAYNYESHDNALAVTDKNNHLWAVTKGGLKEIWQDTNEIWSDVTHYMSEIGVHDNHFGIRVDTFGTLWIAHSEKGIVQYSIKPNVRGKQSALRLLNKFTPGVHYPKSPLESFSIDKKNLLWVSLEHKRLLILDPQKKQPFIKQLDSSNGLPHERCRSIFHDNSGNVWLGYERAGIIRIPVHEVNIILSGKRMLNNRALVGEKITFPVGIKGDAVRTIFQDNEGIMWFGTSQNGLLMWDSGTFRSFTIQQGLPSNAVNSIHLNGRNHLWIGTMMGATYLEKQTSLFYFNSDLLGKSILSSGSTRNGVLWFVSTDGMYVYHPPLTRQIKETPDIKLTRFRVNHKEELWNNDLELTEEQNNCEFEFAAITYVNDYAVQYRWRLTGESNWHPWTSYNIASYSRLEPGEYSLEVEALDHLADVKDKKTVAYHFQIVTPFWKQLWFRIPIWFVLVGTGPIVYAKRISKFKRKQRAQQEFSRKLIEGQEQERKRIAHELHDSLGQNLILIKNNADLGLLQSNRYEQGIKQKFDEISSIASEVLKETKNISYNLRPYQLESLGLTQTLETTLAQIEKSTSLVITKKIDDINALVKKENEIHLYRIIQECMNNILKHSNATGATIEIRKLEKEIVVSVHDNGKGLISEQPNSHQGLGHRGIEERVRILDGKFIITSSPNAGTSIIIHIPIGETST
ncbi:MAG: hypothetical protein HYZ34_15105 [Ignavibacteriae bacterium]|nr:hypothetical protein [Ignavibacteriota bacterium]